MVGDSLVHAGHWEDMFPFLSIKNYGIGSDKTFDILNRIQPILNSSPKYAFLMVGVNDLKRIPISEVFENYVKIINILLYNSIKVYVQSTISVQGNKYPERLQNIFIFNKMISEYCIKNGIPYIDLNSHLSTEELGLKKEYTYDGIHLNGKGYEVWRSILSNYAPFKLD